MSAWDWVTWVTLKIWTIVSQNIKNTGVNTALDVVIISSTIANQAGLPFHLALESQHNCEARQGFVLDLLSTNHSQLQNLYVPAIKWFQILNSLPGRQLTSLTEQNSSRIIGLNCRTQEFSRCIFTFCSHSEDPGVGHVVPHSSWESPQTPEQGILKCSVLEWLPLKQEDEQLALKREHWKETQE